MAALQMRLHRLTLVMVLVQEMRGLSLAMVALEGELTEKIATRFALPWTQLLRSILDSNPTSA